MARTSSTGDPHVEAALRSLQTTLDFGSRRAVFRTMSDAVRSHWPERPAPAPPDMASALRDDGVVSLGQILSPEQSRQVVRYFSGRPCYRAHVKGSSDGQPVPLDAVKSGCASYSLEDTINAPYLLELANHPILLALAESYLGCAPSLYSLNAFWTFPSSESEKVGTQKMHRDVDDFKFCTCFVFLTGVRRGDGAHFYVKRTHDPDKLKEWVDQNNADSGIDRFENLDPDAFFHAVLNDTETAKRIAEELFASIKGPAGTAVLEDSWGLHHGDLVTSGPRLLFWARYGMYRNPAHESDRLGTVPWSSVGERLPRDDYHLFVNRILLDPL